MTASSDEDEIKIKEEKLTDTHQLMGRQLDVNETRWGRNWEAVSVWVVVKNSFEKQTNEEKSLW